MPNLKDIRRRIKSVKNTQQITKAMKMVSTARLRRAKERVLAAGPYARTMTTVLQDLAGQAGEISHPLLDPREGDSILLVLVTSDKGLCGAFNTNLLKAAQQFIADHADKKVQMVTIGRRGRDFFRRRGANIVSDYVDVTGGVVKYEDAVEIARDVIARFTDEDGSIDCVYVLYTEFKSAISQHVTTKQLLPISDITGEAPEGLTPTDYIYEQPPAEIFGRLLPRFIETQIYYSMIESTASEQGARMTAMDSASNNAADLIDRLTLVANRVRQAAITNEIIEVVSGAQALEG
ncbi:MAG TPA: ATP synthase F1 subunit gamma [Blastocatellia bacterium]|nr:ATP synthase F1 subunit gamma [Blastocatellia bacterium]